MTFKPMLLATAVLTLSTPTWAAHGMPSGYSAQSFPATYFTNRTATLSATVVQVLLLDQRSFIEAQAADERGQLQRWSLEWQPRWQLNQDGVYRATLRPGDGVVVTGNPSRNADVHKMWVQSIRRPFDDWTWGGPLD